LPPTVLNKVVGTKFKLINGYAGSNEGMLAMERGETDGAMTTWDTLRSTRPEWIAQKKINIIVQYALERHRQMPDVPTMVELGKTPEDRQLLAVFAAGATVGRSIIAPPNVPPERVESLRNAFAEMVKDPQFLADAENTRLDVDPMLGKELQAIVASV